MQAPVNPPYPELGNATEWREKNKVILILNKDFGVDETVTGSKIAVMDFFLDQAEAKSYHKVS